MPVCGKKTIRVMEFSVATSTALYRTESSAVIDVQHPTILFIKTLYNRQVGHNKLESSNSKRPNATGGRLILGLFNNVASTTETV